MWTHRTCSRRYYVWVGVVGGYLVLLKIVVIGSDLIIIFQPFFMYHQTIYEAKRCVQHKRLNCHFNQHILDPSHIPSTWQSIKIVPNDCNNKVAEHHVLRLKQRWQDILYAHLQKTILFSQALQYHLSQTGACLFIHAGCNYDSPSIILVKQSGSEWYWHTRKVLQVWF